VSTKATQQRSGAGSSTACRSSSRIADRLRLPAGSLTDPGQQAFWLLRAQFTIAPVLFGLDKFVGVLVDWPTYLWSGADRLLPGSAADVMLVVGVVEIVAGVLVAVRPRIGGYVVAARLAGIIVNRCWPAASPTSPARPGAAARRARARPAGSRHRPQGGRMTTLVPDLPVARVLTPCRVCCA
jgi:hypothetical protein